MRIVFNLLKKIARVSGLYSIIGFLALLGMFGYLTISKSSARIESELVNAAAFIQSTYAQGDLVTLRTHLSSLALSRSWGISSFKNVDGQTIWENTENPENNSADRSLVRKSLWSLLQSYDKKTFDSFPYVVKSFPIKSWMQEPIGTFTARLDIANEIGDYLQWLIVTGLIFSLYWAIYLWLAYRTATTALAPVNELSALMASRAKEVGLEFLSQEDGAADELTQIFTHFNELTNRWKIATSGLVDAERLKTQVDMARQVAHDIRSPLSALNMVSASLTEVSEDQRLLIRSAIQRINDIANNLLKKGQVAPAEAKPSNGATLNDSQVEPVMLSALVDGVMSEKRALYRSQVNIEMNAYLQKGYGLFVMARQEELARVLSNLIDNSVEACDLGGAIDVNLWGHEDFVYIEINDTGKGIPEEIVKLIGQKGISYGKEGSQSGSGLGLYHAKRIVEGYGGTLKIESQVSRGTSVKLALPRTPAPPWFVESVTVPFRGFFVSVDDDQSIHQVWVGRLASANTLASKIVHKKFSSIDSFMDWTSGTPKQNAAVYLIDYEFLNQSSNGLEAIEKAGISPCSILVTSRYDDPEICAYAQRLGVKLIPKALAPLVPIVIEPPNYLPES